MPKNSAITKNQAATAESTLLKALQSPTAKPNLTSTATQKQLPSSTQPGSSNYTFKVTPSGAVQVFKNGQYIGSDIPHSPTAGELAFLGKQQYSGPTINQIIGSSAGLQGQYAPQLNPNLVLRQSATAEAALLKALQPPGATTTVPSALTPSSFQAVQPAPGSALYPGRPFLGVGQNAIDSAFSSGPPGTTQQSARPFLGIGQSVIDKSFSTPTSTTTARPINPLPQGFGQNTSPSVYRPSSADAFLRSVVSDPKRSLGDRQMAAQALNDTPTFREIAAIGLGKGLTVPAIQASPPQPTTIVPAQPTASNYSFVPTQYGTVQVSQNGKIVATTTPQLAAQQYGYKTPQATNLPLGQQPNAPLNSAVLKNQTGKADDALLKVLQPSATFSPALTSGFTVSRTSQTASVLASDLMTKLPKAVALEGLKSAIEISVKNSLDLAMPAGLSPARQTELMNELTAIWKSDLNRANFAPIAGGFVSQAAEGLIVGKFVDKSATMVADFAASAVAKRTSNPFAIEFARSATELAIVDAYAARAGSVGGVLVANGTRITEASIGLAVDTTNAAKSIRAYEVQVNNAINRAQLEPDPAMRARLLKTAINASSALNALKNEHPLINTLSNITVEGTVESLRSWIP